MPELPIKLSIFISLILFVLPLWAQNNKQDLAQIELVAKQFLHQQLAGTVKGNIHIKFAKLDSRLQLHDCNQSLSAYLPPGAQALHTSTVGVRCNGQRPWSVFIPVKIQLLQKVVSVNKPLHRNHQIKASDLILSEKNILRIKQGYYLDKTQLIGKLIKQPIQAGRVIHPYQIKEPILVNKGQNVPIIAKINQLTVRMKGRALQNGRIGDLIRVKNRHSGKIIEGKILKNGDILVMKE